LPRTLRLLQHELQVVDKTGYSRQPEVLTFSHRYIDIVTAACVDDESCVIDFGDADIPPISLYMKAPMCAVSTIEMMVKRSHDLEASRRKTMMLASLVMMDIEQFGLERSNQMGTARVSYNADTEVPQCDDVPEEKVVELLSSDDE